MRPRSHGIVQTQLDKHRKPGSVSPSGKVMDHFGAVLWRAAGAAVHYSSAVLQRHRGRGMLYSMGVELLVPGSAWIYPASTTQPLAPGFQGLASDGCAATRLPGHRQNKHSYSLPGKALLCSSPGSYISYLYKPGALKVTYSTAVFMARGGQG